MAAVPSLLVELVIALGPAGPVGPAAPDNTVSWTSGSDTVRLGRSVSVTVVSIIR